MTMFYHLQTVAKYESKLLMRSWFYRVFLVLAVLILFSFNFAALIGVEGGFWPMRSLPSNIPYINLLFLNIGQAIIAVFLSSEFVKTDKKLDTSEVFYVRPLSNAAYVIGKIGGNLSVFIRLNLIIISIVVVLNLASGVTIDWLAYITYFLLISIPTLIFIFGLSVSLMLILKNQAITFVLLLGYIGLTLFYIQSKFYYLFDYMMYSLPLVKSSMVGFTNWGVLINHRCIYLFLGLGFICLSIFLFKRLPNTRFGRNGWLVVSFFLFITGGLAGYRHVYSIWQATKMRTLYTEINNRYVHTPKIVIENYDIQVEQFPKTITSEVSMLGLALESSSIFTFCLNPGLHIREIRSEEKVLSFQREKQIILVDFGREIQQGESVSLTIKYDGTIKEDFCYLDIPSEILQQEFEVELFKIDKRYSFHHPNFLLFTPETYWYPRPGTSYSSESPDWQQVYFSNFRLTVKTHQGLQAISQGTLKESFLKWPEKKSVISNDQPFIFETDFPIPSLTLIIGDYEQKKVDVEGTEFGLWYIRGHDYFSTVFENIVDTIPTLINNFRKSVEHRYTLDYSYNRFSIVEVPVQFFSYLRTWSQAQEKMLPEMVLFPEKGCLFNEADFAKNVKNTKNWAKRNGQEITDDEAIIRTLNSFLNTFQSPESGINWSRDRGSVHMSLKPNPYFIFPQLYNFKYNVFSSQWPVANRLIEVYLQNKADNDQWIREMNGISNNEKANLLMALHPFNEILSDREQRGLLDHVISAKAKDLFAPAERNIGCIEFRDSLRSVLKRNIFSNLRFENLLDTMGLLTGENLVTRLKKWDEITRLPVYIVGSPQVVRITNRDKEVYVVKLQITNDSDIDGIINIQTGVGGWFTPYDPRSNRHVSLSARETKQLVSVWDETPRNIIVNTLISANLPSVLNMPVNHISRERNSPVDKEGDFIITNVSYHSPGEVIVDNEDTQLFELSKPEIMGLLPKWLEKAGDQSFPYSGVSLWSPPLQWTLTTHEKFFGTHIRSAYVIRNGNGGQTATWKIPVPSTGAYDLFYYVTKTEETRRGRNNPNRGRGGRGRGSEAEYLFKIKYDQTEENAYLNLRRAEDGWNFLGTYFWEEDTVSVTLSNKNKTNAVIADAVKIVKRQSLEE